MSSTSHFRLITKISAIFVVATLSTESVLAAPILTLDARYNIPSGMEQAPLAEKKISDIQKFLFETRSPVASNTLFDTENSKFLELSDTNSKTYGLSLSGSMLSDYSGGKAIYDGNIAILDLPTAGSGRLTYEAPYYCDTLISSLAKYTKIGSNICLSGYSAFADAYANNNERTYVDVLKTDEVKNADLSHFSILVFPDITLGKHGEILDSIGENGRAKIKAFVEAGGMVYFSSKSLILADKMELTKSVVDESTLIKHRANQGKIALENGWEFERSILNSGLYEGTTYSAKSGSGYFDYLLGSYYLHPQNDPSIVPIRDFDIKNDVGYYFQDLSTLENSDIDAESAVAAFYKPYGNGLVVYNGGNSLYSPQKSSHILFRNHTLNAFMLSFAREVHASAKVVQKSNPELKERLVPSLEKDILLEYDLASMNVFNENVSDTVATISLAGAGIAFSDTLPAGCALAENNAAILICTKGTLASGEKWNLSFNIRINEPTFTQAGLGIPVTRTTLEYTNPKGTHIIQNLSKQTIDALESAKLRASLNIDPPGFYPLKGEGVYEDQILNVNNTTSTEANEANYTVTIPLISPLFDESDQALLASKIVFSKSYYDRIKNEATKTGLYPFKNEWTCAVSGITTEDRCQDFVVSSELSSGSVLVDNYDEPVLRKKTNSSEVLVNILSGTLLNPIGEKILKQTYLPDSDKLFTHASPRQMVFETPVKKELLFARQDIYFYNNPAFPLPKGIDNRNQYISIDSSNIGCQKIDGAYDEAHGVVAGKYPNALGCNTSTKSPWTTSKVSWNSLPAGVEQTDYLYPIDPKNNITSASDLEWFDANGNYIGQKDENGNTSETYPITYTQGAYASFDLPARSTPKGGYIEITLPDTLSPSSAYVSADHIAITKTEVSGNVVRAYFYRGQMPNDQSLKSTVSVALDGVNTAIPAQSVKIYALSYNLSGNPINEYKVEQSLLTSFSVLGLLKLPAVKLTFELPRRKRISESLVDTIGVTDAQKAALFSRPEYYDKSMVFNKNTSADLGALADKAGLTVDQKSSLLTLFAALPFESYIRKWENLEPFVRFGTYIQELAFHRTVWGPAEDHPISDPGIMADRAMIASIGNVGISPIPFSEYMTTGVSQIIPLAHENGRVNYRDIFGREFASPIRTTIPESVPLPPPVKDFMMNTTYEMYDSSGVRHDFWDGETELEIRANIKLSNNYPKYFDPTKCADNATGLKYGACYDGAGTGTTGYTGSTNYKLSDKTLDSTDFFWAGKVELFSTKKLADDFMAALQAQLSGSGVTNYTVPTLHRAQDGVGSISLAAGEKINDSARNYSPEVEKYHPEGYISNSMWNLTHLDYDDTPYAKGYPYHMDNLLPNPSTDIKLPHNMIAFPVARGSSYKHKYFSEDPWYLQYETQNTGKIEGNLHPYTSWKYAGKTGWWPENLQNRDNTLLSGQSASNDVSYAKNGFEYVKPSLLDPDRYSYLGGTNVYQCLFNPDELKSSDTMLAYGANTVKNNIIPIIPWITKNTSDSFQYLSMYPCRRGAYAPDELSKVNNVVETESAFWLYFASNLRGEAKEALDVISRLSPISGQKYEGDAKIVEGGRFTYWNPAFGPNSFQIVDNPVSIVKTINSSLSLEKELLPYSLKTTSTDAYLLYTIKDPGELQVDANGKETPRKWSDESYTDSRGNGNYGASITVGDTENGSAEKSMLAPGEKTLVRLDVYNNSGYDWAMLGSGSVVNDNGQFTTHISGGIDFVIDGQNEALNANDLLSKITRNVLKPTAYNFLDVSIPDELKPYVTIVPSSANIRTPGTFSDFDFVNVTTIRDGFKGSYFLSLALDPNTPESLRGKVQEIKLALKKEYFDRIPGGNDPVNWGESPTLPPLKFAIKDADGNAFYRSGYSTGVTLDFAYDSGFTVDSATEISEDGEIALRLAAGDGTNKHRRLRETMESLSSSGYALRTFQANVSASGSMSVGTIRLADGGITEFPYLTSSGNIVPKTRILVHLKRESLSDGEHLVENNSSLSYENFVGKAKNAVSSGSLVGYAQGPKLDISYKTVVTDNSLGELEIQKLVDGQNTIEAKLFLKNTGTDVAFDPTIKLKVADGVTIRNEYISGAIISGNTIEIKNFLSESGAALSWVEGEAVGPGITNFFPVYLSYSGSYSPTPVSLIEEASYEFTPYDPVLPSLSGSSASGALALDFVQTDATVDKNTPGVLTLTFSGNSPGIYWDVLDGVNPLITKEKADEYGYLAQDISINPLEAHNLHLSAFFKGNTGDFKQIKDIPVAIAKEDPKLDVLSTSKTESTRIDAALETNALPQYGTQYEATLDQSGEIFTGSILSSQTGGLLVSFDGVDVANNSDISISAKDASGSILAHTGWTLAGEGNRLYDLGASRTSKNIKLSFSTNKVGRTCYMVKRDGQTITPNCLTVRNEKTNFTDTDADVFKDYAYRVSLYTFASGSVADTSNPPLLYSDVFYTSPDPNLSSIPVRIVSDSESGNDLAFTKVKDFGDTYLIEDTPVRYAVRMKSADGGDIEQSGSGQVHIVYGSGELLFISDGWDKTLDSPTIVRNAWEVNGYTKSAVVEVGDENAPMILDQFVQIVIENVWSKPDRVTSIHAGVEREIPLCIAGGTIKECYTYSTNKVIITTKKFSSFTVWEKVRTTSGGGGGSVMRMDICPNGDYSASYYDGSCGVKPTQVATVSGGSSSSSSSGGGGSVSYVPSTPVPQAKPTITGTSASGAVVPSTQATSKKPEVTQKPVVSKKPVATKKPVTTKKTTTKKPVVTKKTTLKSGDILEQGNGYTIRKWGKKNVRKVK